MHVFIYWFCLYKNSCGNRISKVQVLNGLREVIVREIVVGGARVI